MFYGHAYFVSYSDENSAEAVKYFGYATLNFVPLSLK